MIRSPVPATLVTGATGAGKTTLIWRWLAGRKPSQRWAVLVNDFGASTLHDAPGVREGAVAVREVGGCICCSAQVALRTALVKLLREVEPGRLVIEVSAAAEPDALLRLLRERGLAAAVELRSIVCVVDPRQLADERYATNAAYRAQIAAADCVAIDGGDTAAVRQRIETIAGKAVRFLKPSDLS
jgi:G3E family GTPase